MPTGTWNVKVKNGPTHTYDYALTTQQEKMTEQELKVMYAAYLNLPVEQIAWVREL